VCAAENEETLTGLDTVIKSTLGVLPMLHEKTIVWLNRDEPKRETVPLTPEGKNPTLVVESKLSALRKRLDEEKLSVFHGVAYRR
jgi:hypothetical protein